MYFNPLVIEPIIKSIKIRDCNLSVCDVPLDGEEYKKAVEYSFNNWSTTKTGIWGGGVLNKKNDPRRTERIGKLGEIAFSKLTGLPVDLTYRVRGDKQDFAFDGKVIDIKTNHERKYDTGFIKGVNEYGKPVSLKNDIFVLAYLEEECDGTARIVIVGYEEKAKTLKRPLRKPKARGSWMNHEIPYEETVPIFNY